MHLQMSVQMQTPASVQMHIQASVQMHIQASVQMHARACVQMHTGALPPLPSLVTAPTHPLTAPALPQYYPCASVSGHCPVSLLVFSHGLATL